MPDPHVNLRQAGRVGSDFGLGSVSPRISASAVVETGASVGQGTFVWDLAHLRAGCRVGSRCVIGRNAFIDAGVLVGDNCKLQNNVLVYSPAVLGDGVFVGPAAVLSNDRYPRAVNPDGSPKQAEDWTPLSVTVEQGASIGAAAVIVGGVSVGRWAMVGAGAVVSKDVPAYALVTGVPAMQVSWVGRHGRRLIHESGNAWRCPESGDTYLETDGRLEPSRS